MKKLYAVWDRDAESIGGQVLVSSRDEAAIRAFSDLLSNPETLPGKHPQSFELWYLGEVVEAPLGPSLNIEKSHCVLTGEQWLALQSRGPEAVVNG